MRRENAIGEANIGEIGTDGVGTGIERDRAAGQREGVTLWRAGRRE